MPKAKTSISIEQTLLKQAQAWGNAQRPAWSFSTLVEIALEDFLATQDQPNRKKNGTVKASSNVELIQAA